MDERQVTSNPMYAFREILRDHILRDRYVGSSGLILYSFTLVKTMKPTNSSEVQGGEESQL